MNFDFVQIDKKTETGFDWIPLRRQIGTVERITHFESQRIARAEPARLDAERSAFFKHGIPKLHRIARTKENFNAVLSGVTGPRHRNVCSVEREIDNVISRRQIDIIAEERMK